MPALYTSIQAVLSLYASGRTTGIVLDAGDGVSHAVPVYEGFAITNSIQRIDVAGRDITEYLQTLLRKSGYVFHTSAEKEVVRHIKEAVTYVAHDPRKEEKDWAQVKLDQSKVVEYTLPDGNKMKVSGAYLCCDMGQWAESEDEAQREASCGMRLTPFLDRSRALQGTRDPVRPRNHRP